jgi:hypothetical protein
MQFFTTLFLELPEYAARYVPPHVPATFQPVMSVGISEDGSYGFVEFATEELASTAFEFGNTVFLERPMKIDRPMKFIPTGCVPPMDVMPLRLTGRIPMTQNVSAHNINVPTAQTLLAANVQVPGGTARLRKYIDVNQLDGSSSSRMLSLSSLEAEWVMDQSFMIGADPSRGTNSAVAMGRAKKVKSPEVQEELLYYPHVAVMQRRVEEFININSLQGECAQFLRYLIGDSNSIPLLQKVMDEEYLLNVNTAVETASAVVMGRVQKAREEMPTEFGPSMERRKREIYVGNLSVGQVNATILKDLFTPACETLPPYNKAVGPPITDVILAPDSFSAFVEFQNEDLAALIIPIFDQIKLLGSNLAVCKPTQQNYAEMHFKMHMKAVENGTISPQTPLGAPPVSIAGFTPGQPRRG